MTREMLTVFITCLFISLHHFVVCQNNGQLSFHPNVALFVREDASGTVAVAHLRDFVRVDGRPTTATFSYGIARSIHHQPDAYDAFAVAPDGRVTVTGSLDYESEKWKYYLNASVFDHGRLAYGFFHINLQNVNDNPPLFVFGNACTRSCPRMHYEATIDEYWTDKKLDDFDSGPVRAVDADNDTIEYSFVTGSPNDYDTFIVIHNATGDLHISQPARVTSALFFSMIVKAKSKSTILQPIGNSSQVKNDAYAIVVIWIRYRTLPRYLSYSMSTGSRFLPMSTVLLLSTPAVLSRAWR